MHFQPFAFPRRLKPQLVVVLSTARLKPCPFKSRVPSHPSKPNFNSARLIVRLKNIYFRISHLPGEIRQGTASLDRMASNGVALRETNLHVEFNPQLGGLNS